jgi:hypothetical protein
MEEKQMVKTKYGYKPKAMSTVGMTISQLQEARRSPAVSLRRIAWGRRKGEMVMGDGSPLAGITTGATSTAEAIEKIKLVSAKQAANCKSFADGAKRTKGSCEVKYLVDDVLAEMPTAAAERGAAAGSLTIVRYLTGAGASVAALSE